LLLKDILLSILRISSSTILISVYSLSDRKSNRYAKQSCDPTSEADPKAIFRKRLESNPPRLEPSAILKI
jgi:hypothetical protein